MRIKIRLTTKSQMRLESLVGVEGVDIVAGNPAIRRQAIRTHLKTGAHV